MAMHDNGQALIEFSLVIAILMLVVVGGLKIGLTIANSLAMNNVADAGVFRAGLGTPLTDVEAWMRTDLQKKAVNPDTVVINVSCQPLSCEYGSLVTVTMTKTIAINAVLWQADFPLVARAAGLVQKEAGP